MYKPDIVQKIYREKSQKAQAILVQEPQAERNEQVHILGRLIENVRSYNEDGSLRNRLLRD